MKEQFKIATSTAPATLIFDPMNEYGDTDRRQLLAACGYLPQWALQRNKGEGMAAAIERQYVFYAGQMTGGTVTREGTYTYPGDPDLHPYVAICPAGDEGTMYIYPHAIVAITHPDRPAWVSRCD